MGQSPAHQLDDFKSFRYKKLALMEWMNADILWLLLLIPLLFAGAFRLLQIRKATLDRVWSLQTGSVRSFSNRLVQIVSVLLTLAFFILAAAHLRKGDEPIEKEVEKAQLILAIDISRSMLAEDVKPNRLTLAKTISTELIRSLPMDQIGSIVFAGNAYVNMPLTTDLSALPSFINNVSTETAGTQGTAIAEAIRLAMGSMSQGEPQGKLLIILSDGEEHEAEAPEAAAEAAALGMQIHTVGIGTSSGGTIPIQQGRQTRALKDASGQTVVTKLQASLLQTIAENGKGKYFPYQDLYGTVDQLAAHIQNTAQRSVVTTDFRSYRYYYTWFLTAGFLCLILAIFMEWKLRS